MKHLAPLMALFGLAFLGGCNPAASKIEAQRRAATTQEEQPAQQELEPAPKAAKQEAAQSGGGDDIQIFAPELGGMAPVMGTENLQGGGGAPAGMHLKEKAKGLGSQGSSSLDQLDSDY